MKTHYFFVLIATAILTSSCSNNPPLLDSSKPLTYSFGQPNRKEVTPQQSKHLGKPSAESKQAGTYYSANGNSCRRLSSSRSVCYIGGKWLESVRVSGKG